MIPSCNLRSTALFATHVTIIYKKKRGQTWCCLHAMSHVKGGLNRKRQENNGGCLLCGLARLRVKLSHSTAMAKLQTPGLSSLLKSRHVLDWTYSLFVTLRLCQALVAHGSRILVMHNIYIHLQDIIHLCYLHWLSHLVKCQRLVKVILNFFKLWNSCHERI